MTITSLVGRHRASVTCTEAQAAAVHVTDAQAQVRTTKMFDDWEEPPSQFSA
jgi:hypothetical protein